MLKLYKIGEISIDWRQWLVGWNYYGEFGLNVFIGPLRLQVYPDRLK